MAATYSVGVFVYLGTPEIEISHLLFTFHNDYSSVEVQHCIYTTSRSQLSRSDKNCVLSKRQTQWPVLRGCHVPSCQPQPRTPVLHSIDALQPPSRQLHIPITTAVHAVCLSMHIKEMTTSQTVAATNHCQPAWPSSRFLPTSPPPPPHTFASQQPARTADPRSGAESSVHASIRATCQGAPHLLASTPPPLLTPAQPHATSCSRLHGRRLSGRAAATPARCRLQPTAPRRRAACRPPTRAPPLASA